uniref:Uncharacterized protein n=2 Tax=Astyanax mexicanus TaxID=7994 RepID=A0A8B9GQQ1_ASTMX
VLEDDEPHHVDRQPQRALDGLGGDGEEEGGQEHGVGERAHHLHPAQAVGAALRAAAARQAGGHQAHAQRHHVGQHVEGVRDQRDGVPRVARHDLRHEEHHGFCTLGPKVVPHWNSCISETACAHF